MDRLMEVANVVVLEQAHLLRKNTALFSLRDNTEHRNYTTVVSDLCAMDTPLVHTLGDVSSDVQPLPFRSSFATFHLGKCC